MDKSSKSTNSAAEERLRELEREMMGTVTQGAPPTVAKGWQSLSTWVHGLTGLTKVAVVAVIGLVAFGILSLLLKTVMAIVSLVAMAAIAYLLWQAFFATKQQNTRN
jgi:hypothetical protein